MTNKETVDLLPRDASAILGALGNGELCYPLETVARNLNEEFGLGVTPKRVREVHKSLAVLGFAHGGPLYKEDDGLLAGFGYWRTSAGDKLAAAPQLALTCISQEERIAEVTAERDELRTALLFIAGRSDDLSSRMSAQAALTNTGEFRG